MGERKVVSKYLPPDFDPTLVPRSKKPKDGLVSVRMMLPFSIQCSTCSTFMYRGRKFNSKKENVQGANGKYLGIQRFRFYIKCTACSQPVTFLTDPKNADYEMENGATRNYELSKDQQKSEEAHEQDVESTEKEDPLKGLENRVLASQREMQDMDNLEEIKAMNMRHSQMRSGDDPQAIMEARERNQQQLNELEMEEIDDKLTEEDEALVKSIQFGKRTEIKRLDERDEKEIEKRRKEQTMMFEKQLKESKKEKPKMPIIKVKRKRVSTPNTDNGKKQNPGPSGLALLAGYGSDSDSD